MSLSAAFVIFLLLGTVFGGSLILSWLVAKYSAKYQIVDDAKSNPERKRKTRPVPLLGGSGFVLVSCVGMGLIWLINKFNWFDLSSEIGMNLQGFRLYWILLAIGIMLVGGYLDDRYRLSPKYQIVYINLAILIAIFLGGLRITDLSYPFDQIIPDSNLVSYLVTYVWLGFCIAATKFLDGHDGLVTTVGIVGLLTIAAISLFPNVNQPIIFIFALIWVAGLCGFLPFNFPSARSYLGEGASEIIGFIIGALAVISGAKVATASTVIGLFIIDLLFVWFLRLLEKRNPITSADRLHWHYRLVDLGVSKVQVLTVTAIILLVMAHIGLAVPTEYKTFVLIGQGIALVGIFGLTLFLKKLKRV